MTKLHWGGSIATLAVLSLSAVALFRARREPPPDPAPQKTVERKLSDASCLADEMASRSSRISQAAPPAAPAGASSAAGTVRGKVALPWQERRKSTYAYALYAITADGRLEGPKTVANTDQFELVGLTPGRKAILFYPLLENLTLPYQIVDVPEKGDVEVVLRPRIPSLLSGRVVDANGMGVGGVMVVAHESLPLPGELYLQGKPEAATDLERTLEPVLNPAAAASDEIVSLYVHLEPLSGRLSRGVMADAKGQFRLPISSPTDPVPLTISRGKTDVLKEETVLPGSGAVRIIVPTP